MPRCSIHFERENRDDYSFNGEKSDLITANNSVYYYNRIPYNYVCLVVMNTMHT
jgi:hypothetical protein